MPYPVHPKPSEIAQRTALMNYEPSFGETFAAGASEALRSSTVGAAIATRRTKVGFTEEDAAQAWFPDAAEFIPPPALLGEDEWRNGPYFREGLTYPKGGLTQNVAEVLAERKDEAEINAFKLERGSGVAKWTGIIAGSIPDPLNFIPFIGPAARAGAIARFGEIGGRVLAGAADAGIGAILSEPALYALADAYQEDRDIRDSLLNIGMALGIGGVIGGVGAVVSKRPVTERVGAIRKAVDDMVNERPVDVTPVMPAKRALEKSDPPELQAAVRQAQETPHFARTPEQQSLLDEIDPDAEKSLDWRSVAPDEYRVNDALEPTSPKNELTHYAPDESVRPEEVEAIIGRPLDEAEKADIAATNEKATSLTKRAKAITDAVACVFGE